MFDILYFCDFLPHDAMQNAILLQQIVHPSVCLSVTLRYCDHIGWKSSKIISQLVSLGCLLFANNITCPLQGEHPEILAGIGVGYRKSSFRCTKAPSLKHGKIGPRLRCWGLIGSHTCTFDWCKKNQWPQMTSERDSRSSILLMPQNGQNLSDVEVSWSNRSHSAVLKVKKEAPERELLSLPFSLPPSSTARSRLPNWMGYHSLLFHLPSLLLLLLSPFTLRPLRSRPLKYS